MDNHKAIAKHIGAILTANGYTKKGDTFYLRSGSIQWLLDVRASPRSKRVTVMLGAAAQDSLSAPEPHFDAVDAPMVGNLAQCPPRNADSTKSWAASLTCVLDPACAENDDRREQIEYLFNQVAATLDSIKTVDKLREAIAELEWTVLILPALRELMI